MTPRLGTIGINAMRLSSARVLVELVLDDLQPDEAPEQQPERRQHQNHRDAEPEAEAGKVALGVVKVAHRLAGRQIGRSGFCSTGWYCGRSRMNVAGIQSSDATKGAAK